MGAMKIEVFIPHTTISSLLNECVILSESEGWDTLKSSGHS